MHINHPYHLVIVRDIPLQRTRSETLKAFGIGYILREPPIFNIREDN